MTLKKPECKHCGSTAKVQLYWCARNLLKAPMKTHYCAHCAEIICQGRRRIDPEARPV